MMNVAVAVVVLICVFCVICGKPLQFVSAVFSLIYGEYFARVT